MRPFAKVFKWKKLWKTEKNIVSVEGEYVHPTPRMTFEGVGMSAIPPVDEAITGFENMVEKVKISTNRRRGRRGRYSISWDLFVGSWFEHHIGLQ